LKDVLFHIGLHFDWACALRGHQLVAVRASGTLERYVRMDIPVDSSLGLSKLSESNLRKILSENGAITFYQGVTSKCRPGKPYGSSQTADYLEFYCPGSELELIESLDLVGSSPFYPPSRWEKFQWRIWPWWHRP
jgi:hypothetical protein